MTHLAGQIRKLFIQKARITKRIHRLQKIERRENMAKDEGYHYETFGGHRYRIPNSIKKREIAETYD